MPLRGRRSPDHAAVSGLRTSVALLADVDSDRLNRARCESLLDELAFVADRLNDPLAVRTAQMIADFVGQRLRQPRWDGSITFEGD